MTTSVNQMSWLKKYGSLISFLTLLSVLVGSYFVYLYWFDKPQTYLLIDNVSDSPLNVTFGSKNLGTLNAHSYFKVEIISDGNTKLVITDQAGHAFDEGEFPITMAKSGMRCYVYSIAGKGTYGVSTLEYRTAGSSDRDPHGYEPMALESKVFSIDTHDHPQVRTCELDFAFPQTVETYGRGPTVQFVGLLCHIDKNNQPMCPGL